MTTQELQASPLWHFLAVIVTVRWRRVAFHSIYGNVIKSVILLFMYRSTSPCIVKTWLLIPNKSSWNKRWFYQEMIVSYILWVNDLHWETLTIELLIFHWADYSLQRLQILLRSHEITWHYIIKRNLCTHTCTHTRIIYC